MYKPFTIQIIYIHLVLNSAPQSIIVWNSTLVNRQTKSSRYGNLGFLGYISHSSFMFFHVNNCFPYRWNVNDTDFSILYLQ